MRDYKAIIKKGLSAGWKLIPVGRDKTPSIGEWKSDFTPQDMDSKKVFKDISAVALRTGPDDIEGLDIDIKYWLRDDIYEELVKRTKEYSVDLFNKLVIQKTKNDGYHWIYKFKGLKDGNKKLAARKLTEEEIDKKQDELLDKGESLEKIDRITSKAVKVLLETRGVGGYILIDPSEGYKFIQGDLKSITYISEEEREFLWDLFKSYHEVLSEDNKIEYAPVKNELVQMAITPFDDYDGRTSSQDCLNLLSSHGWTIGKTFQSKVKLKRPGDSDSPYSGYYELDRKRFSVFSTSTEFEAETRYKHSAVYTILECNGDFNFAAKQLFADGYGNLGENSRLENVYKRKEQPTVPSTPSDFDKFISKPDKGWDRIEDFIDGKIELSKPTGVDFWDRYFIWKILNMYSLTAHKGRGKTIIVQALQVISVIVNDWKWVIAAKENSTDDYKENLFRYFAHCDVKDLRENSPKEYEFWKAYIDDRFVFLEGIETVEEALLVTKYIVEKDPKTTYALFMDPINSFLTGFGSKKQITYETGVEIAIKVLDFTMNICTVFLTQHTIISRQRLGMEGVSSSMAEGGYFINKSSYTATLNREQGTNTNIFNIDNVRDRKTGGNETKKDNPLIIEWNTYDIDVSMQDGSAEQKNFIEYLQNVKLGKVKSYKEAREQSEIKEFAESIKPATVEEAFEPVEHKHKDPQDLIDQLYSEKDEPKF